MPARRASTARRATACVPDDLLRRARRTAERAVRQVAAELLRRHRAGRPGAVRRKGEGDFVTATDVRAERTLRRLLLAGVPEAGFLGEETPPAGLARDLVWIVDPIDGTSNFAAGLPHFAVAAALLFRRDPVVAVLWCAPELAAYVAVKGQGAFRDGVRVRMPNGRADDGAILGAQWHRGATGLTFLDRLASTGARIRTFGCTVAQLADVAMGRLDANVQQQGRIWDVAAAGLVVVEAGGRFTDWQGNDVFPFAALDHRHVPSLAAGPAVHRQMLAALRGPHRELSPPPPRRRAATRR